MGKSIVFTHYGIGDRDGVNAIMFRNVVGLLNLTEEYTISLAGCLSPNITEYEESYGQKFNCIDIPEFSPGSCGKNIEDCSVQEYIEVGVKLFEVIKEKLAPFDVIVVENLQVGNYPPMAYAFYLYTRWCYEHRSEKRFIYRAHDFFWHRPENLVNVVKFNAATNPAAPDWHTMFFPNIPNVHYIAINSGSMKFIFEHGVPEERLMFLPNCIDNLFIKPGDDKSAGFRTKLKDEWGIHDDEEIIFSPIRCTPRKNVEESLLLLQVLNRLSEEHPGIHRSLRHGMKFRLILSMNITEGKAAKYSSAIEEFVAENNIPAHIGFKGMIDLKRTVGEDGTITKYSLADAYAISRTVLTTSTLEGFGFVFIEPWYTDRILIGRDIPDVTYDFKIAGGMRFRALYKALTVNGIDFPSIGASQMQIEHDGNIMNPQRMKQKLDIIKKVQDNEFFLAFINENRRQLEPLVEGLRTPKITGRTIAHNRQVVEELYTQKAAAINFNRLIRQIHT